MTSTKADYIYRLYRALQKVTANRPLFEIKDDLYFLVKTKSLLYTYISSVYKYLRPKVVGIAN